MQQTTSWGDTQKLLAFVIVVAFIIVIFTWMFFAPKGRCRGYRGAQYPGRNAGRLCRHGGEFLFWQQPGPAPTRIQTIANLANPAAVTVPCGSAAYTPGMSHDAPGRVHHAARRR